MTKGESDQFEAALCEYKLAQKWAIEDNSRIGYELYDSVQEEIADLYTALERVVFGTM
jgi:hypothetical protein|tara:strand:+ start:877 stop:1050 length:174 start_codon:yes stop_codon:yes gene_type:complete